MCIRPQPELELHVKISDTERAQSTFGRWGRQKVHETIAKAWFNTFWEMRLAKGARDCCESNICISKKLLWILAKCEKLLGWSEHCWIRWQNVHETSHKNRKKQRGWRHFGKMKLANLLILDALVSWFSDSAIHWFIDSLNYWTTGSSHWIVESLIHEFIDSLNCCIVD